MVNLLLYTCLRSHTELLSTHQNRVLAAQSLSNQTLAVNPTKKRVNLSAVVAACNTSPKKEQMLPRLLIFIRYPAQHPMNMASKSFATARINKKK